MQTKYCCQWGCSFRGCARSYCWWFVLLWFQRNKYAGFPFLAIVIFLIVIVLPCKKLSTFFLAEVFPVLWVKQPNANQLNAMLLNGSTMAEWHGRFLPAVICNLRREAHYGVAIGCNGMFIWQNFCHPPLITLVEYLLLVLDSF